MIFRMKERVLNFFHSEYLFTYSQNTPESSHPRPNSHVSTQNHRKAVQHPYLLPIHLQFVQRFKSLWDF